MLQPIDVLNFWFSERIQPFWFKSTPALDAEYRERFTRAAEDAAAGRLDGWRVTSGDALALVLLLDQAPRNLHRGTPAAFAQDASARHEAATAITAAFDAELSPEQRAFLYMPFMHSEEMADQDRGLALYTALGIENNLRYMIAHRHVIARFGRFPHRNDILGRNSTPEEIAFLKDPKAWF